MADTPYRIRVTGANPYTVRVRTAAQGPQGIQGPQGEQGLPGAGYTLPIATNTVLGGVKVGNNLSVDANGVLSGADGYVLPFANATTLGGIIVGSGLAVTGSGVLSSAVAWGDISGKPAFAQVATTGAYADLSGVPNLNVYLTTTSAATTYLPSANFTYANITGKPTFATVATSGSYTDLSNKPTLFDGSYTSLTNVPATFAPSAHTHTVSQITDFPAFATVATTGDYNDLINKPAAISAAWGAISGTLSSQTDLQAALDGKQPTGSYLTTATAASTYQPIGSYATTASLSDYTPQTRTITAGTGLSGGGDLSANRTLSLAASGVAAGQYGSGSVIPKITIDTYGRITAVQNDTVYPDWNNISGRPIDSSTGTAVFSMAANLADYELIRAKLKDYSETRATPAISAGSLTLNLETGNFFAVSLNANVSTAIVITNPPATGSVGSFTLELTANGTPYTINWGSIKWPGGTAPTLTSASGKRDIFVFYTSDAGANWYGLVGGQNL